MPRFESYEAWVECDGKRLEEYDVQISDKTVSCWIPSEIGKTFRVGWKGHSDSRERRSSLWFFVDGVVIKKVTPHLKSDRTSSCDMSGIRIDESTIQPLVFSQITWTEDESTADGERPSTSDIGTIAVEVLHVKVLQEIDKYWALKTVPSVINKPLNEKEVKAGTHRAGLSAKTIKVESTGSVFTVPLDKNNPGPYVKFKFNYRPEDFLRARGIIPPQSSYVQGRTGPIKHETSSVPNQSDSISTKQAGTQKRPAPNYEIKLYGDPELTVLHSDSEADSDLDELVRRLEYWQKQQAEIQKQQSVLMSTKNVKVKLLQYWQKQFEDAQKQQAEILEEMKSSGKASSRKRIKREPEAEVTVKREAGAAANDVIDLTLD
ncbi:hypothetical protein DFH11DRAFT_1545232 [Phellopilus nigrolimitatus]|nr:hypothetical protein DFH11DRAFT_1545232 [Phellopilus nigrolimitatus]